MKHTCTHTKMHNANKKQNHKPKYKSKNSRQKKMTKQNNMREKNVHFTFFVYAVNSLIRDVLLNDVYITRETLLERIIFLFQADMSWREHLSQG